MMIAIFWQLSIKRKISEVKGHVGRPRTHRKSSGLLPNNFVSKKVLQRKSSTCAPPLERKKYSVTSQTYPLQLRRSQGRLPEKLQEKSEAKGHLSAQNERDTKIRKKSSTKVVPQDVLSKNP